MPAFIRPFQSEGGREFTKDKPEFDVAGCYYAQREQLAEDAGILNALIGAVRAEHALMPPQWAQWYSVALGFAPDLILELGRAKGNSTALFTQAASRLPHARVVSVCLSDDWTSETVPRLARVVPAGWFDRLDARIAEILEVDYEALLKDARRALVLWDAHGFDVAEVVLGRILPILRERPHLIMMHDISDNRYATVRSYEGQPLWRGSRSLAGAGAEASRVNIGWMNSREDQIVALADFGARNDIEIGSADHAYAQFFGTQRARADQMRQVLGDRFFSVEAHWAFLSLTGKEPPFFFPTVRFHHRCGVSIVDLFPSRPRWFPRMSPLPRLIKTPPVRWQYGAEMRCRPRMEIPPQARRSYRVTLRVEGAPVGVSLLNADSSAFLEVRRVAPGSETVFLPFSDPSTSGPLVVHTWDTPESARVHLDDISVLW